jgi:hypothetical protein
MAQILSRDRVCKFQQYKSIIKTINRQHTGCSQNNCPMPKVTGGNVTTINNPSTTARTTTTGKLCLCTYGGCNYCYTTYTPEAYKVNLPTIDWSFNPTEEQRLGYTERATAQAAQEIDPQLQAIAQALQQYMTQGQNTRNELNPRYTNQSLGIANIVQNTVKQNAIDNAIRRGAENSGWLGSALDSAGQLEVEQRSALEAQRNQDLAAIAALEANQTQATGAQQTALEKLRGQRITTGQAQLENEAWARAQQEKESQFNSALGGEQLRASAYGQNASNQLAGYQTQVGAAMSDADRALQASIAANEQANAQWNQQYQMSTDAYNRARQGATPASVDNSKNYLIPGTIEWYRYNQIQVRLYTKSCYIYRQKISS